MTTREWTQTLAYIKDSIQYTLQAFRSEVIAQTREAIRDDIATMQYAGRFLPIPVTEPTWEMVYKRIMEAEVKDE